MIWGHMHLHRHTGATDVCGRYRALLQQWNLTDNTGSHGRTTPFRFRVSVPAGGNVTIVYEAETNAFAPLLAESEITNTVTVSGGGITPVTAKETVIAESGPKLTITKSVSPVPVTENGTLTYTFLIQNTGNTAALAATGAVVTDIFDPVLSNLAVSYNGTAWSDPANYSYNAATGTFATQEGQITVPAATFTQDATTGEWTVTPGAGTLTVTGTI